MKVHFVRCLDTLSKETVLRVVCWETELPQSRIPNSFTFISSMTEVEAQEEKKLIIKALEVAGYIDTLPTREELISCYLDFADAYGGDIEDLEEQIASGELTIKQMCYALIRSN